MSEFWALLSVTYPDHPIFYRPTVIREPAIAKKIEMHRCARQRGALLVNRMLEASCIVTSTSMDPSARNFRTRAGLGPHYSLRREIELSSQLLRDFLPVGKYFPARAKMS